MIDSITGAMAAGTFGTGVGALLCILIPFRSSRVVGFWLSVAGGVLAAAACFGLLPEGLGLAGLLPVCCAGLLGTVAMLAVSEWLDGESFRMYVNREKRLMRAGILLLIGVALHNIPAGIAIGAGDLTGRGLAMAVCIGLRNIPEGLAVGLSLKLSGVRGHKILLLSLFSGTVTALGAILGYRMGLHAPYLLAAGLSFSAGALLYLSLGVLFSESLRLYRGNTSMVGWAGGLFAGLCLMQLV